MDGSAFLWYIEVKDTAKKRRKWNMGDKRLYKSSENSMLCGVCGGIAEYFDIDPTLVRLAWVILTCFGGAGIWAYIIAAIIIPKR